jgi:hypothetical protein
MDDHRSLRPTDEIESGLVRLRQEHVVRLARSPLPDRDPQDTYTGGQIIALEWLLGVVDSTPLTLRPGIDPQDVCEVDREADRATEMLQIRVPMDLRGRHFAAGVEFALMWARYQTVDAEL